MEYRIPLIDDTGVNVCDVSWSGTLYDGSASVVPVTGHENEARGVANAILAGNWIKDIRFRSEGDVPAANGWNGFEGFFAAIRLVCPSVGLEIDLQSVTTPPLSRARNEEILFNESNGGIE